MIAYLVLIAIVNTSLGFAVAVYLLPPDQLSSLRIRILGMRLRRLGGGVQPSEIPVVDVSTVEEMTPPVVDD